MIDKGIPNEPCAQKPEHTTVFSFPINSPCDSITYSNYSPIKHLDLWLTYQKHWCDHKPSVTINYEDKNFLSIGQWVWNNWEWLSGISFLPQTDHVYDQAPFEAIDKERYDEMISSMPKKIRWKELKKYEQEDTTSNSHAMACVGGACEVVDIIGETE
jgi:ribonucleoside-triphosphate reductase